MSESHWTRHATQWSNVGSPLRPNEEDQSLYWQAIVSHFSAEQIATIRTLLLGVTPELRAIPWPQRSNLIACDLSMQMLQDVWPLAKFSGEFVARINADWMNLPLATNSCSLALGDGCLTTIPAANDCRRIARELHRVLGEDACLIFRLFCAPRNPEHADDIFDDLRRGAVGNFHAFKWRLVMAMHAHDPTLTLADVWTRWDNEFPAKEEVQDLAGWPMASINTLSAYRNATARYSFMSVEEVEQVFAPEFELLNSTQPGYELGERCPIVRFRRRTLRPD